jgi:hypothetical protein
MSSLLNMEIKSVIVGRWRYSWTVLFHRNDHCHAIPQAHYHLKIIKAEMEAVVLALRDATESGDDQGHIDAIRCCAPSDRENHREHFLANSY